MNHLRIEVRLPRAANVAPLSDAAFRLHISALAWCAEEETDGEVPLAIPGTLTAAPRGKRLEAVLDELVKAGLWEAGLGFYSLVGFLDTNPSRDKTSSVRDATKRRVKRHREQSCNGVTESVTSGLQAQDPPFPPHTPPIPPVSQSLPTQGNSSLSLLLPDQTESVGSPRARARKHRARTGIPEEVRPSSAAWSPEQAARLQAIGRDLLREDEQFLAHHRAKGTLSASWASSRSTWVCNAEKGYGAPARASSTQLGMVTQIRSRNPAQENVDRQLERLAVARAEEERKAVS